MIERLLSAINYAPLRLLLALLRRLPREAALRSGAAVGRLLARVPGRRRHTAMVNLRIAFPEWSEAQRRRVHAASLANLGRGLAEVAHLSRLEPRELGRWISVEGLEHVEAAFRDSPPGGVMVITGHFGSWELFAAAFGLWGYRVTLVHRERSSAVLERAVASWRRRAGLETLPLGRAARGGIRALRSGAVLAMAVDQDARRSEGVFVPFFGKAACTRSAPARLAMHTGAPVVPGFLFRCGEGPGHVARFRPALELVPAAGDREEAVRENTRRMTRVVEEAIREAPDHWSWVHRRWRTQPRPGMNPYRIYPRPHPES